MADQFQGGSAGAGRQGDRAAITRLHRRCAARRRGRVDVAYSTLNYKDALAITGAGKIVREFPFVPGIDFAGTVRSSADPRFDARPGGLLTGWGVGERQWGGLAERARVKADWLLPCPRASRWPQTMAIGTAGFTAMLSVMAMEEQGVRPGDGEIVVTGAAGGVGSVAIPLLRAGRLHRGRLERPAGARRLSDRPGRTARGRGPRPVQRGLEGTSGFRELGWCRRFGRRRHPGQPAKGMQQPRRRHRLRARRRRCVQRHGVPVHPARRAADRHRIPPTSQPTSGRRSGRASPATSISACSRA